MVGWCTEKETNMCKQHGETWVAEVQSGNSVQTLNPWAKPKVQVRSGSVLSSGGRFSLWFWPWDIGSNLFKPNSVIGCSKILRINNLLQKWERCGENYSRESSHDLDLLRDAYIIDVGMDIATINTSPVIGRHLLHTFPCNISPYVPSCVIFHHFKTLTQIKVQLGPNQVQTWTWWFSRFGSQFCCCSPVVQFWFTVQENTLQNRTKPNFGNPM